MSQIKAKKKCVIKYWNSLLLGHSALNTMKPEVESLQTLKHQNIIKFYESCEEGQLKSNNAEVTKICYFVMEYNDAITLFDYICFSGPFPEPIARYFFKKLMNAIKYIHKQNVIHRDIKLENILIDKNYDLKLIDFGLSSKVDISQLVKGRLGTKGYQAPELFKSKKSEKDAEVIGTPTDIFSSGVVLLLMVWGKTLFTKENLNEDDNFNLFKENKQNFWNSLTNLILSQELKDLIERMLAPNPFERIEIPKILSHSWMNQKIMPKRLEVVNICKAMNKKVKENPMYIQEIQSLPKAKNEEIRETETLPKLNAVEEIPELFGIYDEPKLSENLVHSNFPFCK